MSDAVRLISVAIRSEQEVVASRQRAREIAELAGFERLDQVRIATVVSEIARNAFQYAGGGKAEFAISLAGRSLAILITDQGPGIPNLRSILDGSYRSATGMGLGIVGARRLMDRFEIESGSGGTRVNLVKRLPASSALRTAADVAALASRLAAAKPLGTFDELRHQNHELMQAIEELRQSRADLQRLNQELEDTNRGVMALYAELDDKAASLRRADEIKSQFLSHMSHEFRTPLNSILALGRLLQSKADGDLTPEQDKQIEYIRRAAAELSEMVNDLLDLAKVESGKISVQPVEFTVANLFGALRGMLRPLQTNEAVALIIEDPDPELTLETDEGKLSQVLRNLVSNALKFTERGEVRVSVSMAEDGLMFSVADTGIGIAAAEQERVFQEFAQVEHPIQRRVKGTGLGLPLSRKLAELLGGRLTVTSEVGVGSTFRLQLARECVVRPPWMPHGIPVADQAPVPDGLDTLLVIDDDEVSRYLVKQMLRSTGLVVTEAENGPLGIERARFDRPRMILLDLNMPGLSGFEVVEELKSEPDTQAIPVVICTSRSLSQGELQRLEGNAAAVVSKRDLNEDDFLLLVERVTGTQLNV